MNKLFSNPIEAQRIRTFVNPEGGILFAQSHGIPREANLYCAIYERPLKEI